MSAKGSIDIQVIVNGEEYRDKAKLWAIEQMGEKAIENSDGSTEIYWWDSDASWLENEIERLAKKLSELDVPPSAWVAYVHYEFAEGLLEDGGVVNIEIRNGKIDVWEESQIEMVPAEPWIEFNLPIKEG
jgi:hypothetical protein